MGIVTLSHNPIRNFPIQFEGLPRFRPPFDVVPGRLRDPRGLPLGQGHGQDPLLEIDRYVARLADRKGVGNIEPTTGGG